jgi:hypothetical protein
LSPPASVLASHPAVLDPGMTFVINVKLVA